MKRKTAKVMKTITKLLSNGEGVCPYVTICAPEGSYAKQNTKEKGIAFIAE